MKKDVKEQAKMREGYTTGACATACAKAALTALISGESQELVTIHLPVGRDATFTMEQCEFSDGKVRCSTIKDAGDDPDATHKAVIEATVSLRDDSEIVIDGGVGVGRVTKPGLPIDVGQAAINPVPRKMIRQEIENVRELFQIERGVNVVISVPEGEEIAKKTLNGRLGIIGGISILGTRGTVVPFSSSAYMASIVQAISVAKAAGCDHLVFTTGGRSEKYAMQLYPTLPEEAFIEMGDFAGFSMKHCKRLGIRNVSLVGMMGKFSKLANGAMMLHSKGSSIDFSFLAKVAEESGAPKDLIEQVLGANTASQVGDLLFASGNESFFKRLSESCCKELLKHVKGGLNVSVSLVSMKGELLGRALNIEES